MNIRAKLIGVFLIFFMISLIAESIFSFNTAENALNKQALNQLQSVASFQRNRIVSIMEQNLELLNLVSSRTQLRLSLARHLDDPGTSHLQPHLEPHLETINRILDDARASIESFNRIFIVTADKRVAASTQASDIGSTFDHEIVGPGSKYNLADHFFLTEDNLPMLYLAGPLILKGRFLGVLVIQSGMSNIIESVRDFSGLGTTGETLLAKKDADGNALFLTPLRFDDKAALKRTLSKNRTRAPVIKAMDNGPQLITDGIDYRGKEVLAATQFIASTGWVLVVKKDKAEAFLPVFNLRRSLFVILLVCGILAVLIAIYIADSISRPITDLTLVARNISNGNLGLRAKTQGSGEIGILARAFNQMAEKLINKNKELNKNNQELVTEIIERKRVEKALIASEKKYRQLVELMQEGIWVTDSEAKTVYANPALCNMLGYRHQDLLGRSMYEFMTEDSIIKYRKKSSEVSAEAYGEFDYELKCSNGNRMMATVLSAQITNEDGSSGGTIAGVMDVTERIRAKQQLQQQSDQLEKLVTSRTASLETAYKELESFSYSVSHDLRTPLRAIDGFSQLLKEDYKDVLDAEAMNYIDRVRLASQNMGQLIDDMLTLSRVTRQKLHSESVHLDMLAGNTILFLHQSEPDRDVVFNCASDMQAEGDERLLQILLDNLIGNAWKYTGNKDKARISLEKIHYHGETVYSVSDNGTGFDMRYRDKLFKAFQRLHSNEFPGTGIGLATVQRIIDRHGGRVWAESTPGEGARFYFTLSGSSTVARKESGAPELSSVSIA